MFIIKELRPLLFWLLDFQLGTQPNSLKQKENVSLIFSAVNFNMFDLHNECDYSETCLHKGFFSTYTGPCEQGELLLDDEPF